MPLWLATVVSSNPINFINAHSFGVVICYYHHEPLIIIVVIQLLLVVFLGVDVIVKVITFLCLRTEGAGGIMFPGCPSVRPSGSPSGFFRLRDNSSIT